VSQSYNTYGDQIDIIRGNAAIIKCRIPSFVADFLDIISWVDNLGTTYSAENSQAHGIVEKS